MTESLSNYEHRVMRCKLDRTVTVAGRRYRPGEPIEGDVPAKHEADFELGVVAQTPPPAEAPGQRVRKIRHDPPVIVQREAFAPVRPTRRDSGLDKVKSEQDD